MQEKINSTIIGKATEWSFAAEIIAKLIVPFTNMILARILAPEAFGVIATITMIVSFADTLSTAGFQKYIIQHDFLSKEDLYDSATVAFWSNLFIEILACILISIFSVPLSILVGNPGYEKALMVSSLILPITGFSSMQEAFFNRSLNFKVLFYRRIVVTLTPFIVTIPLAFLGLNYWSLIIGNLAGGIVKALIMYISCDWKPKVYFSFSKFKKMFNFSFFMILESIAMWSSSYIDILIISNKLGMYYTGLYKTAQSTVTGILSIITGATTSVLFASLSRYQTDDDKFGLLLYNFQRNVAIFVLPIGVGIFCFSDLITSILLGSQWVEASSFIGIWGLCTSLVCVFGTFSREVYRAKGKPNISLIVQLLHLFFIVPVCIYFVGKGFNQLIYARSFAYLQIIFIHMVFIKFMFGLSPSKMFSCVCGPIISSIVMGCFALVLHSLFEDGYVVQLFFIFICGIFYFCVLCFFPSYRKQVKFVISKTIKKIKYILHGIHSKEV